MTPSDPTRIVPFPAAQSDIAPGRSRRRVGVVAAIAGLTLFSCLAIGAGVTAVYAMNPLADEWQCSQGEAPAGNSCYPEGSTLPPGVRWDPFGNRPMSYNCDKDGWVQIERDDINGTDCIREGTAVPRGWHVADN